jgi:hypothetical protein
MKNQVITIGISVVSLLTASPSAFAQTAPTMNQPDNGFFEGPNPEWSTLHSTDSRGTVEHRQYHRDAVQELLQWNAQHRADQGTSAYDGARRAFHQMRNMAHRHFHTDPALFDGSMNSDTGTQTTVTTPRQPTPTTSTPTAPVDTVQGDPVTRTYDTRPSRRSIVAEADQREADRTALRE